MNFSIQHKNKRKDEWTGKTSYQGKAVVTMWSTFSERVAEEFQAAADAFGCSDVVLINEPDYPFSRNVVRAHSTGNAARERIRDEPETKLAGKAEAFCVMSPDGAGLLADRGFYDGISIERLDATAPIVFPIIRRGKRMAKKLDTMVSYWTEYVMYKDSS